MLSSRRSMPALLVSKLALGCFFVAVACAPGCKRGPTLARHRGECRLLGEGNVAWSPPGTCELQVSGDRGTFRYTDARSPEQNITCTGLVRTLDRRVGRHAMTVPACELAPTSVVRSCWPSMRGLELSVMLGPSGQVESHLSFAMGPKSASGCFSEFESVGLVYVTGTLAPVP